MFPFDFDDRQALGMLLPRIDPQRIAVRNPRVADIEKVLRLRVQKSRFRRAHDDVVGVIHSEAELAENVLFGVLRNRLVCLRSVEGTEIAARRGAEDPVVERHQIGGLRAAAAVPRHAEPVGNHVGTRLQKIESADHVPDFKRRRIPAQEDRADPRQGMRGGRRVGRFPLRVEVLEPLPLVDRVLDIHCQAVHRAQDADPLIEVGRLPLESVPADDQNTRIGRRELLGPGEKEGSGRIETGERFQDDLLGTVFRPVDHAGHPRVERSPLPHPAELRKEEIAALLLIGGDLLFGSDLFVPRAPRLPLRVNPGDQVVIHHPFRFGADP